MKWILAGAAGTLSTLAALTILPTAGSGVDGRADWLGTPSGPADAASWTGLSGGGSPESGAPPERPPLDLNRGRCGPGPMRVSDMDWMPGGFFRFRRQDNRRFHEFYFTRAIYSDEFARRGGDYLGDGGPAWSIDYPTADRTMMLVARRLSSLNACEWEHPVSLADPELRYFPFVYSLEWGWATLTEAEVRGLREYLLRGGLLMVDDFWGTREWYNFERQIQRVLPDFPIEEIPRDHLLFRSYYNIQGEILQVPMVGNGRAIGMGIPGARTSEQDGFRAHVRGIFDDTGRLMVVINWNTDLGDALEWAEDPYYPLYFSRFASELFMNTIVYAMTQ